MVRTLPWLKDAPSRASKPPRPPPAKRQKLTHPTSTPSSDSNHPSEPKHRTPRAADRTPSTSPPPRPPSVHALRPGLHADDIYIMVEDEFLATAQLYTKHLHHAEYQRLKALSHTRTADILRPVDPDTAMRTETRRKKDAEERKRKIDARLDPLLASKRVTEAADEESDAGIEQEDPWRGTPLQRFMTVSPRKERGLVGLQGIVSGTRAAAGYAAPARSAEGTPSKARAKASSTKEVLEENSEEDDDDDDDDDNDLDAPMACALTIRKGPSPAHPRRDLGPAAPLGKSLLDKRRKDPPAARPPPPRSFLDISPPPAAITEPPSPHRSSKRNGPTYIKPEYPDPPKPLAKSDLIRQRLRAKREREEQERKLKLEGGGASVDEIPVFLV